ncbi:MAG: hypothetical protein SPL35_05730 [Bacteroidales bacterium]|nr:hypothetical protein [Bacteroidales bacterium]
MKTRKIFKILAFAMLMPAMLLSASCKKEVSTENIAEKGYELPMTINVSRQGDEPASKASFNESTKKLEFTAGDKLYVTGRYNSSSYLFAGTLDYDTETEKFSGTIYTQSEYSGTAEELLTAADMRIATLLPAGHESYGYLSVSGSGYSATLTAEPTVAIALTKAFGVEQLSREQANTYSGGFTLAPQNAILNFTITSLKASTEVAVVFTGSFGSIIHNVTTDSDGSVAFAIGVTGGTDLNDCTLAVDGNTVTLVSSSKVLTAGKIYNISRSAEPASPFAGITTDDIGKVIGADGKLYATVSAATTAGTTASGIIAYVGSKGSVDASSTEYKGLVLALTNASDCMWSYTVTKCVSQTTAIATALSYMDGIACTSTLYKDSHTHPAANAVHNYSTARPSGASDWFIPSLGQWNKIVNGLSGTTVAFTTSANNALKASAFNTKITTAGGTEMSSFLWSCTEQNNAQAWGYSANGGCASYSSKASSWYVRTAFAF